MNHEDTLFENQFLELKSLYDKAGLRRKKTTGASFFKLGCPAIGSIRDSNIRESIQHFNKFEKEKTSSIKRVDKYFDLLDIRTIVKNNNLLKQITENIEQVIWLQDIETNQILYISPTFETVWGRSVQSMIDDPSILIESVHPEDRVQVLVSKPRINHNLSANISNQFALMATYAGSSVEPSLSMIQTTNLTVISTSQKILLNKNK